MIPLIKKVYPGKDNFLLLKDLEKFICSKICLENGIDDKNYTARISIKNIDEYYNENRNFINSHYNIVGSPNVFLIHGVLTGKIEICLEDIFATTVVVQKKNRIHLIFDYLHETTGQREFFWIYNVGIRYGNMRLNEYQKITEYKLSKDSNLYYGMIFNLSNLYCSVKRGNT